MLRAYDQMQREYTTGVACRERKREQEEEQNTF